MKEFIDSLGPVSAIIGAQWGDEGKGKATDMVAEHFDVIARACGGANAGHTIIVKNEKHVFHLLPSGCLHEGKTIVLGSGMVIHLPTLLDEIHTLRDAGVDIVPSIHMAHSAQILLNYHKDIDAYQEEQRAKSGGSIGTTKRGIGPAYVDKTARAGLRMEMLHAGEATLRTELEKRAEIVKHAYDIEVDIASELADLAAAADMIGDDQVVNGPMLLSQLAGEGKSILIEGAQATLLDIDHGTYPYVTSSSTTLAGALQGLGMAPQQVSSCIGIAKAYCTRVGEGHFVTEANEEDGQRLRDRGGEYGATTGRPRRCGWLHIPDLQFARTVNGLTGWNITKLDVLDEEEQIPVGVGEENGEPIYEYLPGWQSSTVGFTSFEELPENAQNYIAFIEEQTGTPVQLIGTGPGREQMIVR